MTAEEAISTIDSALSSYTYDLTEGQREPPKSIEEILHCIEENMREDFSHPRELMGSGIKPRLRNEKFIGLFSLMDIFGFWSDSKKTYNKGSRLADSRHAFNGSHFKYVVSRDKRLLKKSDAAYKYFGINTKCLHINDFKVHLDRKLSVKS